MNRSIVVKFTLCSKIWGHTKAAKLQEEVVTHEIILIGIEVSVSLAGEGNEPVIYKYKRPALKVVDPKAGLDTNCFRAAIPFDMHPMEKKRKEVKLKKMSFFMR